ncbi:hypothetical protein ABT083_26460 [Streptomyces goshikiensis]|uniref:hypothetical protein n=1 Tax=Streptomyces goshikiensis TaxID=1942 RepID=UPI00332733AB
MADLWSIAQGIGAAAGMAALSFQGVAAWRRRHDPRDIDGLREVLDTAYRHLIPVASRPINGSPSLDLVEDSEAVTTVIDLPRYAGRLKDPVLASAVREAGLKYQLAFALGSNLNHPPAERDQDLIARQNDAAQEALNAVRRANSRLDEIERRIRP